MKGKERAVVLLLLVLVCISLVGAINLGIVSTQKTQYYTDETVILSLYALENVDVYINSNTTSYRYIGFVGNTLQFNPKELGQHMITVKNQSNSVVLGNYSFVVHPEIVVESNSGIVSKEYLYLDKEYYLLGDVVRISISNIEEYTLFIQSNDSIYKFLGSPDASLKFSPKTLGDYTVLLEYQNNIIVSKNFSVVEGTNIPPVSSQPDQGEELFMIFDSDNLDKRKHVFASKQNNRIILETEGLAVKRIRFNDLNISGGVHLGIEDVPPQKINLNKNPVFQSYAIDPSQLEFTTATVTITAKGTELYKCADWNFSQQSCFGSWQKIMDIIPGEEYNITISSTDPCFAETGLSTVNFNKSIFLINDSVRGLITVLDGGGFLVSDANVWLSVYTPSNEIYEYSSPINISQVERGVYSFDFFDTGEEGNYSVFALALSDGVNASFSTHFEVRSFVEFEIQRDSPTTVDPWSGPFTSELRIISNINQSVFNLTEIIPSEFIILDVFPSSTSFTIDDRTYLSWSLLPDGTLVTYTVQPPLRSPELFELGPAKILYGNSIFSESRIWYLAVDPTNEYYASSSAGSFTNSNQAADSPDDNYATSVLGDAEDVYSYTFSSLPDNLDSINKIEIVVSLYFSGTRDDDDLVLKYSYDSGANWYNLDGSSFTSDGGTEVSSYPTSASTQYYEITGRMNLTELYVGVQGDRDRGKDSGYTAHVDAVWIRLNYTEKNPPPYSSGVPFTIPSAIYSDDNVIFNATWNDDSSLDTFIFSWNASGSWVNVTNSITKFSGTQNYSVYNTTVTNPADDTIAWRFYANDSDGNWNYTGISAFTVLSPAADYSPVVNLSFPPDSSTNYNGNLIFNCSITDDNDIVNVSLFTNISGEFKLNQTINLSGTSDEDVSVGFVIDDVDNQTSFIWNCLAYDNSTTGNPSFAATNWSVYVSILYEPFVTLVSPQESSTVSSTMVGFNCSVVDGNDIVEVQLFTNISGGGITQTDVNTYSGSDDHDLDSLFDVPGFSHLSTYSWNCKAFDENGNFSFAYSNFTFFVDLQPPNITLESPGDNFVDYDGNVSINCSAQDGGDVVNITLFTNLTGSFAAYDSTLFTSSSDTDVSTIFNVGGLDAGTKFTWSCSVLDNNSLTVFADENRTVSVAVAGKPYFANQSAGDWLNPSYAEGSPNGVTADETINGEETLSVYSFENIPTEGTILAAYISLTYSAAQTDGDDQLDLGYSLSAYDTTNFNLDGSTYDGSATILPAYFPTSLQNQSFQITGALTTQDLQNLRLRIQGDQIGGNDQNVLNIDSLFLTLLFDYPPYYGTPYRDPSTSIFQNTSVTFYTPWHDDYFLDCFIFSINQTGSWQNSSCIPFTPGTSSETANLTRLINASPGTKVLWMFYANDSQGVYNQTPIQSFTVASGNDTIPPSIYNESVTPDTTQAGSTFTIGAFVVDNFGVENVYAEVTDPTSNKTNYSMVDFGGDYYGYDFTGWIGGQYSVLIYGVDGNNNSNVSSTSPQFNVTSLVASERLYHARGETVSLTGYGYSPQSPITFDVLNTTQQSVNGFPKNETSNVNGTAVTSWNIPSSLSYPLGTYTFTANDTQESYLQDSGYFLVIIRPDTATKYDKDNPGGANVISQINDSDDSITTIVSDDNENYINIAFEDNVASGYTLSNLTLGVEHKDDAAYAIRVYLNTTTGWQAASCSPLPVQGSEAIDLCNLNTEIPNLPDPNYILVRLTDDNGLADGNDLADIDFVFLDLNTSISNTLAVSIEIPEVAVATYDYTDSTNNKAYGGSHTTDTPASQLSGTEPSDYSLLVNQDNNRWQTTHTTVGNHVYHTFYFKLTEDESDVTKISFTWEGYITEKGNNVEDIQVLAWDYTNGEYDTIGTSPYTGATSDVLIQIDMTSGLTDYIDSDGEVSILVIADTSMENTGRIRQDIFTDLAEIDVYSYTLLQGYEDINVSAVDADGVSSCTYYFTNYTGYSYFNYEMVQISSFYFYNYSDTLYYPNGIYNLTANCTDGSETDLDILGVRINNQKPTVYLISPEDNYNSTSENMTFTWNVTVGAGQPICNLTLDYAVNLTNVVSNNSGFTSKQVYNIDDGYHNWSVTCKDAGGLTNTSETWIFFVDANGPQITLDYPSPPYYLSVDYMTFLYTPYDLGILNCSLSLDGFVNDTNESVISNQQSSFYSENLNSGIHYWNITCLDQYYQPGYSATEYFYVDLTDPWITLTLPEFDSDSFGFVKFNFTAYDDLDSSLLCNLTVNGFVEVDNIVTDNATPEIINRDLGDGLKWWNVTCWDDSGRFNTSETWNFTVQGAPTVNLVSPDNLSSVNTQGVNFTYYVSDGNGVQNCSLYINQQKNQTKYWYELFNGFSNNSFVVDYMDEAVYNWSVACYDNLSNLGESGVRILTVDRTQPNVTLLKPNNDSFIDYEDLSFNFTVIDNLDSSLTCSLFIDDSIRTSVNENFQAANNTIVERNESDFSDGSYSWFVNCTDDAGNTDMSEIRNFDVTTAPYVSLSYPENNTYSQGNLTFYYYAYSSVGLANCSLYINESYYVGKPAFSNQTNNFSVTGFGEGLLNWSVYCFDTDGINGSSDVFLLNIDNTPPLINLVSPNASVVGNTTVIFNFTISENTPLPVICNLTVNGTVVDPNFLAYNGMNQRTVSGLSKGFNYWNVTCWDNVSLTDYSTTYNFTISLAPEILLLNPPNDSVDTDGNVTLQFRVSNNDIDNCTLYINGVENQTIGGSRIVPYGVSHFNISNLQPQILNWTVGCNNTNGVSANASNGPWKLHIDFVPPNVSLHNPVQGRNYSLTTLTFNWTAYDDIDDVLYCNITLDGFLNQTGISSPNNQSTTTIISGLTPGIHFWNVTCTDGGFTNVSETWNFTISIEPGVELVFPEHDQKFDVDYLNFTYIPSTINESGFVGCTLFLDYQPNITYAPDPSDNGILNNFSVGNIPEGFHDWYVNCTDFADRVAVSETRNFTVDLTNPYVYLTYPNGDVTTGSVDFNFTAIDNLASLLNCNLNNNGTIHVLSGIQNNTPYIHSVSGLTDGLFFWNVTCADTAGRLNYSGTFNYTVAESPQISLGNPPEGYRTNMGNLTFYFTPTDNSGSILNCTLVLDGSLNVSNSSIYEGIANNLTLDNIPYGWHNWTVDCTDPNGNTGTFTPEKGFIIDTLGPGIQLNLPEPDQFFNQDDISFNWTATDEFATNLICNLTIDEFINQTDIPVISGDWINVTVFDFGYGNHNWSITCIDDLNNSNSSELRYFTVNAPDLTITSSNITFSDYNPDYDQNITVYADIFNIGGMDADGADVLFYDGEPGAGGVRINGVQTIDIAAGNSSLANVSWQVPLGLRQVWVIINYSGFELNNSNNNASRYYSLLYSNITFPQNDSFSSSSINLINFTLIDGSSGDINYSVYIDGDYTGLNGTVIDYNNTQVDLTLTEGTHYVQVEAEDYQGRTKNSTPIYITVDLYNSTVNFITENQTWFNDPTPEIAFNITDTVSDTINYTIFVNDNFEFFNFTLNNTNIFRNLSTLPNGTHIIIIESVDVAGHVSNSTPLTIHIDTVPPVPNLLTLNYSWFSNSSPRMDFNITDNLAPTINYSFFVNNKLNSSGSVLNNTSWQDYLQSIPEGKHIITLEATDLAYNSKNSTNITIIVDLTDPTANITFPENNTWTNQSDLLVNFTLTDNLDSLINFTLYLNNVVNHTGAISNNSNHQYNFSSLSEGKYDVFVEAEDEVGKNFNSSVVTVYVDLNHPIPSLITLNESWFNTATPTIEFNITDTLDILLNYTLYVNGSSDKIGAVNNGSYSSDMLSTLANGSYQIILEAKDELFSVNTSPIIIHVDTIEPAITLNNPESGYSTVFDTVSFNWTAYDNLANNLECNLTIDGVVHETVTSESGSWINVTVEGLGSTIHYWNVTCVDLASNINTSVTWNFTILKPDLYVNHSLIFVNPSVAREGEIVFINATIENIGDVNITDAIVQFFDYSSSNSSRSQINGNKTINLTVGDSVVVAVNWTGVVGNHFIEVMADPPLALNGSIFENNESNNYGNYSINISGWHTVAGDFSGGIVLEDSLYDSAFLWNQSNFSANNIFVADLDSIISWTDLYPFGRNTSYSYTPDDFDELDVLLGMTDLSDSVNKTFLVNGNPLLTRTFYGYDQNLTDVPIINSTNTSNFVTGILWDASDDTSEDGQFTQSDAEDVIFITEVNPGKQGLYGIYDFEIRIPAYLRNYDGPDSKTVVFYTEIK